MGWKEDVQIRDLDHDQKLEMTCKKCGHMHALVAGEIAKDEERQFKYLDEIERETQCRARGCRGAVRLSMPRQGETSSFVGGLA